MAHLNLKSFAKIKDSDFDIQDITVFAGKPGTGKSYIMKALYAIEEAYNITYFKKEAIDVYTEFIEIMKQSSSVSKETEESLKNLLLSRNVHVHGYNVEDEFNKNLKNVLTSIFTNMEQISNSFQINFNILNIIFNNNLLKSTVNDTKDSMSVTNEVIFVETPLILEFKKFMTREEGKTPYHIESLLKILDKDYSFTDEEQDEFIDYFITKSKEIIKGNIEDSGDSFVFKTNEKGYDIVNASSGIKSIGLLQYLVTNKALKNGSILFWEEPEVHLHPTWQLKMVELFIELMNAGVKIVFSTHSPYMADYLNALSKKKELRDRVSFNLLSEDNGVVSNTILNEENWQNLQKELLGPLEEVMWQYL